jgi:RHS repeat-associated protein
MQRRFSYDCTPRFVHLYALIASRSTGKERDSESGLDYFGARYYASNMGRWMSPDWADKPEAVPYSDLSNPQSLNLYGYVNNNPLSKADKDDHCLEDACVVEGATAVVAFALTVSAYLQTPSGQRSLANAASSAAATISSTFHNIFSKSDTPASAPATPATDDKQPQPLVGTTQKRRGPGQILICQVGMKQQQKRSGNRPPVRMSKLNQTVIKSQMMAAGCV